MENLSIGIHPQVCDTLIDIIWNYLQPYFEFFAAPLQITPPGWNADDTNSGIAKDIFEIMFETGAAVEFGAAQFLVHTGSTESPKISNSS